MREIKHYFQMPTCKIFHEQCPCNPRLRSYDYLQLNQLETAVRYHHKLLLTCIIYKSECKVRQIFFLRTSPVTKYTASCPHTAHAIIHFYILLEFYIWRICFCQPHKKISSEKKLSHYSLLQPRMLHMS